MVTFQELKWLEAENKYNLSFTLIKKKKPSFYDEGFFFSFMNKIYLILFIPFFIYPNNSLVNKIDIVGNSKTKEYIIERELLHPMDQALDSLIMIEDVNRLYNLGIFSTVEIQLLDSTYNVNLVESLAIIPDLVIDYSEITETWSYGLGIAHLNFLGLDQEFYFGGAFIGEKWFALSLNNPWIYGDHVSFETLIYNMFADNPFYNYRYNESLYYSSIGFHKNIYNKFKFSISYYKHTIKDDTVPDNVIEEVKLKPLTNRYFSFGINYQYDKRDVFIDPLNGHLFELNLRYSKDLIRNLDISQINISFEKYFELELDLLDEPVISYKLSGLFKYPEFNKLPIYEYEYLGGEDYIRGYSSLPQNYPNESFEDKIICSNVIYNHIEFQTTILKRKDYGKIEFGVDGVLFLNSGLGSNNVNKFNIDNILFGYGFGFKFFITGPPAPISIMFGYNPYGQSYTHLND